MSPGTKFGSTGESDINDDDSQTQNGRQVDQSASGTVESADQSIRQRCGTCAKPRGGVLKPAAGKMEAEAPAPAKPDGADIRGFFGKAAGGKAYGCQQIDVKDRD